MTIGETLAVSTGGGVVITTIELKIYREEANNKTPAIEHSYLPLLLVGLLLHPVL
jgi:hypothetical protein